MSIFVILLPIFFVFFVGYASQRFLKLDTGMISKFALYVLMPFLVFQTFYQNDISLSHLKLIMYLIMLCGLLLFIIIIISFLFEYSVKERAGLMLSSAFMNNGNYGTPLILFLFGEKGLEIAIILMVIQQFIMSTLGIYIGAKGGTESEGVLKAIRSIKKMPMVYAALIGTCFNLFDIPIGKLSEGINLIAEAAIPAVMVTLGMNLANIVISKIEWNKLFISLVTKLLLSPIIAFLITILLPVDELTRQIMIILAATPTAANTTLFALQFNVEPQNVSSATLMSTLASMITVPFVIYLVI